MFFQETAPNVTDPSDSFTSTHTPSDHGNSTNPASGFDHDRFTEIMEAENLISRCVYVYSLFGLVGFLTGIFIFVVYARNYRKKRNFEQLDFILFTLTVANFALILFSITDLVRPEPVNTTALGCAVLSFFFNVSYFYTAYTHITISVLAYHHLVRRTLNKWLFSILAAMGPSILFSILVTALTGAGQVANASVNCHVDPLEAPAEYGIVKFIFGLLIPKIIILGFILQDCRKRVCPHPVFLALVTVTFICRMVYNVLLLLRQPQETAEQQPAHPKLMALMIIGELVMFAGSCLCLVCIAIFHKMIKDAAVETVRYITEPCWGFNANRNHNAMTPNIEIKVDHEEAESLN
ncbi:uncharacterized protein LOC144510602 [Mustelus asterias]